MKCCVENASCVENACRALCSDSLEKVHNDVELQSWGSELCRPKEEGGAGLKVNELAHQTTPTRLSLLFSSVSTVCLVLKLFV